MICVDLYDWEEGESCTLCMKSGSHRVADHRHPDYGPVCGSCLGSILIRSRLGRSKIQPSTLGLRSADGYLSRHEIAAGLRAIRAKLEAMP